MEFVFSTLHEALSADVLPPSLSSVADADRHQYINLPSPAPSSLRDRSIRLGPDCRWSLTLQIFLFLLLVVAHLVALCIGFSSYAPPSRSTCLSLQIFQAFSHNLQHYYLPSAVVIHSFGFGPELFLKQVGIKICQYNSCKSKALSLCHLDIRSLD